MNDAFDVIKALLMIGTVVAIIVAWVYNRMRESRAYKRGLAAAAEGKPRVALGHFLEALEAWGFNTAHSTPAQFIADLERLQELARRVREQMEAAGQTVDVVELSKLCNEQIAIYGDKSNLTLVSGGLKDEPARKVAKLTARMEEARKKILRDCSRYRAVAAK